VPAVLVTGAGRGIGAAIAAQLASSGWDVYGGVRGGAELPDGVTPVQLDITSAEDLAALDGALPVRLDAVVNNAGIVVGGPVEALPLDELRRQLEVNVVGQVAVTQAVMPRLRESRGRVVFISSVSGVVATPMTGAYNASKFGLEALADSLRMEVRPWGIRVVLVQPAQTDTALWQEAEAEIDRTEALLTPEHRALYAGHVKGWRKRLPLNQKLAVPPENVAAAVEKALTAKRPRARYVVGAGPRVQAAMSKVTPTPVMDTVLRAGTGVPRKP
jgi:NAD(P)-dependent dehydrogenase (short-subunit alcohol dehydrogenase family)